MAEERDLTFGLYWQGYTEEERKALHDAGFKPGRRRGRKTMAYSLSDEMIVLRILIRRSLGLALDGKPDPSKQPDPIKVARLVAELGRIARMEKPKSDAVPTAPPGLVAIVGDEELQRQVTAAEMAEKCT